MAELRLLDQVAEAVRLRHYSIRTEKAYIGWIKRFILFHNKQHPSKLNENDIRKFLSHLAVKERVSASTQNQALNLIIPPTNWFSERTLY